MYRTCKMGLQGGRSNTSMSTGRLAMLQVSRCLRWRLTWLSIGQTSTSKFAVVAKPKMPAMVVESCQRFQEPNHAFGVENGGPRRSTHLRPIRPPSSIEVQPRERPSTWGGGCEASGRGGGCEGASRSQGGGLRIRPAFVSASPVLANG